MWAVSSVGQFVHSLPPQSMSSSSKFLRVSEQCCGLMSVMLIGSRQSSASSGCVFVVVHSLRSLHARVRMLFLQRSHVPHFQFSVQLKGIAIPPPAPLFVPAAATGMICVPPPPLDPEIPDAVGVRVEV